MGWLKNKWNAHSLKWVKCGQNLWARSQHLRSESARLSKSNPYSFALPKTPYSHCCVNICLNVSPGKNYEINLQWKWNRQSLNPILVKHSCNEFHRFSLNFYRQANSLCGKSTSIIIHEWISSVECYHFMREPPRNYESSSLWVDWQYNSRTQNGMDKFKRSNGSFNFKLSHITD